MIDVTAVYISDMMLCVHSGMFHCLIIDKMGWHGTGPKQLMKSMVIIAKPVGRLRASTKKSVSMIPCSLHSFFVLMKSF
jgi:hypothetical protein